VWWHMSLIPIHRRLRQEDLKFKVNLCFIVKPCLKTPLINKIKNGKIKSSQIEPLIVKYAIL
jgi:hypothetical protein